MAVVYLTGVLEDGTPRADGVPENPRATLTVTQDTTTQVLVRCVTSAGLPLPSAGTATLIVKKSPHDLVPLVQLAGSWSPLLAGPGVVVFSFLPATLQNLDWGRYVYDIRLTDGSVVNVLVPASPFQIAPAL